MSSPEFDPSEAVTFDLAFGHVHLDGAPTRVMVPADALLALCEAAGEDEAANLGHAIGDAMGRRVAVRLGPDPDKRAEAVRAAGFERAVSELAGELALIGLGALSAERWGRALVFVVDQCPMGDGGDPLVAVILQAALRALTGNAQARMLPLVREGARSRFLLVSGAAVEGVRERLERGESWGAVLAALHGGGGKA